MSRKRSVHLAKDPQQFTTEDLKAIRESFSYRYKIEESLIKFEYQESLQYCKNVTRLCQNLSQAIDLEIQLKKKFMDSFSQYLMVEDNIPIEINIRKIRYDQLTYLMDEWENSLNEPSFFQPLDCLYSIEHRNILFSRVFVEEKQNIEEYFETLSEKKMLKGVDLYQLLVDILSRYFLYEYSTDNETFFEKVNSFNNFLEVVHQFINSSSRIIVDNKSKDFQLVKLYQFEALIYFWESINPELELRSDKRFSICNKQIQTESHEILLHFDKEVQTLQSKQKNLNLEEIINGTLKQLNKLTEIEADLQKLQIIQNMCESLRKEKIKLAQYERSKSTAKKYEYRCNLSSNNRQQRFFDTNSQKSDIQQQKTERISMRVSQSPREKKSSPSKKPKNKNETIDNRDTYQFNRDQNNQTTKSQKQVTRKSPQKQKRRQAESKESYDTFYENGNSQTSSARKLRNLYNIDLTLDHIHSESEGLGDRINLRRIDTNSSEGIGILNLLELIYHNYSDRGTGFMDNGKLHQLFVDIGIIQNKESVLELQSLKKKEIKNPNRIKQAEFLEIMGSIMEEDEDLTFDVISEFVDLYIKEKGRSTLEPSLRNYENMSNPKNSNKSQSLLRVNLSGIQPKESLLKNEFSVQNLNYLRNDFSVQSLNPVFSKGGGYEKESRRKRFAYCQETPKFQNQGSFKRLNEVRSEFSREKKSLPLPNFRKGFNEKYEKY